MVKIQQKINSMVKMQLNLFLIPSKAELLRWFKIFLIVISVIVIWSNHFRWDGRFWFWDFWWAGNWIARFIFWAWTAVVWWGRLLLSMRIFSWSDSQSLLRSISIQMTTVFASLIWWTARRSMLASVIWWTAWWSMTRRDFMNAA